MGYQRKEPEEKHLFVVVHSGALITSSHFWPSSTGSNLSARSDQIFCPFSFLFFGHVERAGYELRRLLPSGRCSDQSIKVIPLFEQVQYRYSADKRGLKYVSPGRVDRQASLSIQKLATLLFCRAVTDQTQTQNLSFCLFESLQSNY